jgi:hypothetical protein
MLDPKGSRGFESLLLRQTVSTFLSLWSDLPRKVEFGGQICGTDWTRKPFSALKANQFASFTSDFSENLSMVPFRAYDKRVAQLTSLSLAN